MNNFARAALAAAAMATASLAGGAAQAATLIVDVTGALSYGARCTIGSCGPTNANGNTVMLFDIGAFSQVTNMAYNVSISSVGRSYRQDMMFSLSDSAGGDRTSVRPGYAHGSGTGTYTGARDYLVAPLFSLFTGADGLLRIEFSDDYDDFRDAVDGRWNSGTITLTYNPVVSAVPEPAAWAMMITGFGLAGVTLRRRRAATVAA